MQSRIHFSTDRSRARTSVQSTPGQHGLSAHPSSSLSQNGPVYPVTQTQGTSRNWSLLLTLKSQPPPFYKDILNNETLITYNDWNTTQLKSAWLRCGNTRNVTWIHDTGTSHIALQNITECLSISSFLKHRPWFKY